MVVNAHTPKPASGDFKPPHVRDPVDQKGCLFPCLTDVGVDCEVKANGKHDVKLEAGEDGEDDGSFIRPSERLERNSLEGQGDDLTTSGNESVNGTYSGSARSSSCTDPKPVKSALRRTSSDRIGLRVQWAPDVYDPFPSMASHTKGQKKAPKPALVSRRARRHQNVKGGHHGKSKKVSKGDRGAGNMSVKATECDPLEVSAAGDVPCEVQDDGLIVSVEQYRDGEDEDASSGLPGSGIWVTPDTDMAEVSIAATINERAATVLATETAVEGESMPKAVPDALKTSKKRSKRNIRKGNACEVKPSVLPSCAVEDVSSKRLAGATALASGEVEQAKGLLLGALVRARSLKANVEQARCLRLLADVQNSQQRESSLLSAIECFAATALAFEHAEALLCLAQHKVHELLGEVEVHPANWFWLCEQSGFRSDKCVSTLQVTKLYLQKAATLLLNKHLIAPATGANAATGICLESPTGRRRKTKGQQSLSVELTAATVVMGSICEVWGKVCLLLREFDEAQAQLAAASNNALWCKDCPEEAVQVLEILDALACKGTVAGTFVLECAVY